MVAQPERTTPIVSTRTYRIFTYPPFKLIFNSHMTKTLVYCLRLCVLPTIRPEPIVSQEQTSQC
ncbi:hypothetical protein BN2476_750150 [Paraburkholderia piptadeniae]|uniref:Uncharacterized protein n=1 Tax=Paraburkholderia piptadeniae TaxID=1701573 RepID=A0A1N7STD4_9BURK|nr:hypothetical protein BN2476_750150 [Paraburkholderia piptadeniae]